MANEINQLEDLNGVVHDLEDTAARSAIQTLDGQAVKSVNSKTPTAGAVTVEAEDVPYDPTGTGLEAQNVQSAVSELKNTINGKQDALTFDNTPTEDSTNPVTSGGLYSLLNPVASEATGQSILTTETTMNTTLNTLLTRLVDAHPTAEAGDLIVQDLVQENVLLAQLAVNIEESEVF